MYCSCYSTPGCYSRRPGVEDRGWSHRSGTQCPGDLEVGWRRVRLHRARGDEERGFLG
jgi:hypothetical protein